MPSKNEVKQQFRELMGEDRHKSHPLNYVVAVSSGLNVTQEIPNEAYKRAAWASNQGASFIEISIGGPAQIYNEWNNLLNISRQLGLSFDCHFPVQVPFDYANPHRGRREQMGFFYGHEFMYKFIDAWGEFKQAVESQEDVNGRQQHVYGINSHLVKGTIPRREERMSSDVSVDMFGDRIVESRIFSVPAFRVGFFKDYLWEENLKDNFSLMQSLASEIEGFSDFNTIFRRVIVDYMSSNSYLDDTMLDKISNLDDPDNIRENLDWLVNNNPEYVNMKREIRQFISSNFREQSVRQAPLTDRGEKLMAYLDSDGFDAAYTELSKNEKNDFIDSLMGNIEMLQSSAVRNIAGVGTDVPENLSDLKKHREGSTIAQNVPRFDPYLHTNARWAFLIPKELWTKKAKYTLRAQEKYADVMDEVTEIVKNELKDAIIERLKITKDYNGHRDYFKNIDRNMSVGEVAFRDIINFRGGQFEDQLNRESVIYWYIMPWYIPFSDNKHLQYMWDQITKIKSSKYSLKNLDKYRDRLEELKNSKDYDWIAAAVAGAYVWGHFTQFRGRGQEKTLVEKLDEYNLTLDWESHNVGSQGNGKLWKPHDIIKVCRAINDTKVNGKKHEVLYCTIDMEHLARNGYDPIWLINGNKDKNLRGIDKGDGKMITKQHITHPALDEQKHHHQPIRRGDTTVFSHIHSLVEKGFCERNDRPSILMYELGAEKAESTYMIRLMMAMMEVGITPNDLSGTNADKVWEKFDNDAQEISLEEFLILKFYGLTDEEWHHEWQEIFEHALDPLGDMLEGTSPDHTWSGRGALEHGENRPEDWQQEEYQ